MDLWQFSFSFPVYVVVGKASLLQIPQWISFLSFSRWRSYKSKMGARPSSASSTRCVECQQAYPQSRKVRKCTVSLPRNVLFLYSHSSLDMALFTLSAHLVSGQWESNWALASSSCWPPIPAWLLSRGAGHAAEGSVLFLSETVCSRPLALHG